ncbi:MAG TPA: hypothetical protein VFZ57_02120 [Thermoanaerobaculia bacterium]|nr:hypothetical protein [Thermoanaerobaculia bacterium]
MKKFVVCSLFLGFCLAAAPALAQEHYTEGPVWAVNYIRTKPGKFDDYMKYLRSSYMFSAGEAKKQGLILDTKILVNTPRDANDWDIAIATLYPSFGKAMDFNQADDDKRKAIAESQFKTKDEAKQREIIAPRFTMRDALGTRYLREVTLRPMP